MSASSTYPRIAVVEIPGKGKGIVALEPIHRGTRIIAEKPRIRVPYSTDPFRRRISDLRTLSEGDLAFFMSFPCDDGLDPIEGRLRHLIPCAGSPDEAFGLFETVCRFNHTCYSPLGRPNALYTWVEERKEEIVHATEDIAETEEITVAYIQAKTHTEDPQALLVQHWGFQCQCAGCQRPRPERLASLRRIKSYRQYSDKLPMRMLPFSGERPLHLLKDIEHNILSICAEGYVWEIGTCAHDAFQLCAFHGDGASAARWEVMAREVHRVIHGTDGDGYKNSASLVAKPSTFREWAALGTAKKFRGPSDEVVACFKTAVMSSNPSRCNNRDCPSKDSGTDFKRCKPCIDKLGLEVNYCSVECQTADWKAGHKSACGKAVKV
ncbi:SET domain-containing protein [Mycena chlorophos]|uniref:SET domain-containing protein n=1 Tax=Mycena chlorophos TaxID=658473 RepID=A0A8H6VVB0_MYCCL|nr:SET domain-containing protein [Mycena chlorophos]